MHTLQDLLIPATNETPEISFEYSNHRLSISGESYPENAMAFYGPVRASLQDYLDKLPINSNIEIETNIALRYFNSSSTKLIRALVTMLNTAASNGKLVALNWFHDADDDMMTEFGQDLREEHVALSFNSIAANIA